MSTLYSWRISFLFNSGECLKAYIKSTYSNSKDVSEYLRKAPPDEFLEFHNASENKHIFVRMRDVSVFMISEPSESDN